MYKLCKLGVLMGLAATASLSLAARGMSDHKDSAKTLPRYRPVVTVTTTPYIGLRSSYNADDLLTNLSTLNEDLRLLQQRSLVLKDIHDKGYSFGHRPVIEISGGLEGQAIAGTLSDGSPSSDIDLDKAELDINAMVSEWAAGLFSIEYDNGTRLNPQGIADPRVNNSNLFLKRGFFTFGNLNKLPVYMTIGQMYVPFGQYSSGMISDPMTKLIACTDARTVLLGVAKNGFYASGYAFRADNQNDKGQTLINDGGVNVGFSGKIGSATNIGVGAGYIIDMAGSAGMQSTGIASTTDGFIGFKGNEQLAHNVGGLDIHAKVNYKSVSLIGEYVTAVKKFAEQDLNYNGKGAKPSAFQVEMMMDLPFSKPTNIAVGYNRDMQSLMLNLPKQRVDFAINTSLIKNTIEAIEYRHDTQYGSKDYYENTQAAGKKISGTGHSENVVTLQAGIYF